MTDRTESARRRQIAVIISAAIFAMLPAAVSAQESVTVAGYGGAMRKGFDAALVNPAAQKVGVKIRSETHGDLPSIRVQVQSGAPAWDLVHLGGDECARGESEGLFEPLDLSTFDDASIPATARGKSWVATNYYSVVMAWRTDKVKQPPKSWADFWDAKALPGRRAIAGLAQETLEIALLADGVAKDKLYPLDVERAFKKLEEIKPNITVWWTSGAQSAQLLNDGEVDMVMAWNGRISALTKEGAKVAYTYNQGILQSTSLCVLKGAPNLPTAIKFLNEAVDPVHQANLPLHIDYGPANPKAYDTKVISEARVKELPSAPENAKVQALMSYAWWTSPAGEAAEKRWLQFMQK